MVERAVALLLLGACIGLNASAHGGGLDASGCHHDRKRGGYHCHRSGYTPAPPTTRLAPRAASPPAPGYLSPGGSSNGPKVSADVVFTAQKMLAMLGCDPGTVDGQSGPATRSAVERFQKARGLPVTGTVSDRLLTDLVGALTEAPVCSD